MQGEGNRIHQGLTIEWLVKVRDRPACYACSRALSSSRVVVSWMVGRIGTVAGAALGALLGAAAGNPAKGAWIGAAHNPFQINRHRSCQMIKMSFCIKDHYAPSCFKPPGRS